MNRDDVDTSLEEPTVDTMSTDALMPETKPALALVPKARNGGVYTSSATARPGKDWLERVPPREQTGSGDPERALEGETSGSKRARKSPFWTDVTRWSMDLLFTLLPIIVGPGGQLTDVRRRIRPRHGAIVAGAVTAAFVVAGLFAMSGEYAEDPRSQLMSQDDFSGDTSEGRASRDQRAVDAAPMATVVDLTVVQHPSAYTLAGRISDGDDGDVLWIVLRAEGRYRSAHRVHVDSVGRFTVPIPRKESPREFEVLLVRAVPLADLPGYLSDHPDATAALPEGMTTVSTLRVLRHGNTMAET